MINILFSGCSYVKGVGLEDEHNNPGHFTNILANNLFNNYSIDNIGIGGESNERIFLDSLHNLTKNHYDYAFVSWTSLQRYVFWAGLELYECRRHLTPATNFTSDYLITEHNGNDISWSSKKLAELNNLFLLLNHSHYYIRDLVSYVNILIALARYRRTKLYFINNILPWDQNYFKYINNVIVPSDLTNYTNELLNSSNRDDDQINKLYHMMQTHYIEKGGINETYWLNLYQSFFSIMDDVGNDGIHPGLKSHKKFAELLIKEFKNKIG